MSQIETIKFMYFEALNDEDLLYILEYPSDVLQSIEHKFYLSFFREPKNFSTNLDILSGYR